MQSSPSFIALIKSAAANSSIIAHGLSGASWKLTRCDEERLSALVQETREPELLLRCLLNRGLEAADRIRRFLAPDFVSHLYAPTLLRDMHHAVERLHRAIENCERILIVTDFDVDGTTSSVILSTVIKICGGRDLVSCYIPDRFSEGYGLSKQIVEKAAAENYRIILTADIGIKSHAEARLARERGIDLIICDHHLPDGEDVPANAFAVLCPKGSSGTDYPNKHLAACGVSLKLADALLAKHERREMILASLAKLAAIGTIADMVDLSEDENRAIVRQGLQTLNNRSNNHGLNALLRVSKVSNPLTTQDIGFKVGPRINAAGRIAHAGTVLDLFAASTETEAMQLAGQLNAMNVERQQIQHSLMEKLFAAVRKLQPLPHIIVLAGTEEEGFHRGVVGIACSKIVEATGRPTFICAINEEGQAHGSARSINGFHIVEAMNSVSELLIKHGGHPMAAGFTIAADKIEDFRYRLNRYAEEILSTESLGKTFVADAELSVEQLTFDTIRLLARLEPHGTGNARPLFAVRQAPIKHVSLMKDKHLKFLLKTEGRQEVSAVWWNAMQYLPVVEGKERVSFIASLEINKWKDRETVQLMVKDACVE